MINLSELEHDALTELINIGMGRAAASLSELVGQRVELQVPRLEVLARGSAAQAFELGEEPVSAVRQIFSGPFTGDALLLFPETRSLELVHVLMPDMPLEAVSELEPEALVEVGNILLNACLGSIANVLEARFDCDMPVFAKTSLAALFTPSGGDSDAVLLVLQVRFRLAESDIAGYLVFLMDFDSLKTFKGVIESHLRRSLGSTQ